MRDFGVAGSVAVVAGFVVAVGLYAVLQMTTTNTNTTHEEDEKIPQKTAAQKQHEGGGRQTVGEHIFKSDEVIGYYLFAEFVGSWKVCFESE